MQKIKKAPALMIAIAFLFVLGISFAGYLGARKSHADDNEDGQTYQSGDGGSGTQTYQSDDNKDNEDSNQPTDSTGSKSTEDHPSTSTDNNKNNSSNHHESENEDSNNKSDSNSNKSSDDASEHENESEGGAGSATSNNGGAVSANVQELAQQVVVLDQEVAQAEAQINAVSATGGNVTTYTTSLNNVKSLIAQIQSDIANNNTASAQTLVQQAHTNIGNLKDALGSVLGDKEESGAEVGDVSENENENENGQTNQNASANVNANTNQNNKETETENNNSSDQTVAKQYENTVAQFVHNLQAVADQNATNGIGQQVSAIAQAQNNTQNKVAQALDDANSRGGFLTFLIGPKYSDLSIVQNEIATNQTQIQSLTKVMDQLQDQNSKSVIQDQINALQNQDSNLQQFVNSNENKASLFGWLFRLF